MNEAEVTSYSEAIEVLGARVAALGLKQADFDELAGFPAGLSGKIFGLLQIRRLGPEKMFDALRAAGLRIRLEVDPEQTAKMQARIAQNFIPRQANQARAGNSASKAGPAVLSRILKPFAKMGGCARMAKMSREEMRAHQKKAAMAGVLKRRKKRKAAIKAARTRKQRLRLEGKGE